jgi:hypothetical protein
MISARFCVHGFTKLTFSYVSMLSHVANVAKAHADAPSATAIPGKSEFILSSITSHGGTWGNDIAAICQTHLAKEVEEFTLLIEGSCIRVEISQR